MPLSVPSNGISARSSQTSIRLCLSSSSHSCTHFALTPFWCWLLLIFFGLEKLSLVYKRRTAMRGEFVWGDEIIHRNAHKDSLCAAFLHIFFFSFLFLKVERQNRADEEEAMWVLKDWATIARAKVDKIWEDSYYSCFFFLIEFSWFFFFFWV